MLRVTTGGRAVFIRLGLRHSQDSICSSHGSGWLSVENQHSAARDAKNYSTHRKPTLLFQLSLWLRFAARTLVALLFQEPPRTTRYVFPIEPYTPGDSRRPLCR
jgi:hypothetical protein